MNTAFQKQKENANKGNRNENIKLENELETKRKIMKVKIQEKKDEIRNLVECIGEVEKELTDLNIDLELLNNYGKNSNINSQIAEVENKQKKSLGRKATLANLGKGLFMINSLRVSIGKKQESGENPNDMIDKVKKKRLRLKELLKTKENELHQLKGELKYFTNQLLKHYHDLLKEGVDTRQDGLIWIIKAINGLSSKVVLSSLPNFLDEGAIKFLFNYVSWDKEHCRLKDQRDKIKEKLKDIQEKTDKDKSAKVASTFKTILDTENKEENNSPERPDSYNCYVTRNNSSCKEEEHKNYRNGFISIENLNTIEKPTDVMKNFNSKGISIHSTKIDNHLNINVDKLQIKNVEDILSVKEKSRTSANRMFKDLFDIDNKMAKIKNGMNSLRTREMNRLFKEFNMNDYERRFKTTRYAVVSALIGEENTNVELTRQNLENKVVLEKLKKCRIFNVMDKNDNLKVEIKSRDNSIIKSPIIKDFMPNKDNSDLKNIFYKSDQMSEISKFSLNSMQAKKNNIEKYYNLNDGNFLKKNKRKFNGSNTSIGFFNRSSANSLSLKG